MLHYYVQDPETGRSKTRAWVAEFLEAFHSSTYEYEPAINYEKYKIGEEPRPIIVTPAISDRLLGAVPAPMEVLYVNKAPNQLKTYAGRAAHVPSCRNPDETLWCEVADVSKACQTLPPEQRRVLYLKYIRDMGDHEIAHLLGVSLSTVTTLVSDMLDTITDVLDGKQRPCPPSR